jgi:hypothetical protein
METPLDRLQSLHGAPPLLDESFPLPLDAPFGTRTANAAGVSSKALGRLVTQGLLIRMSKGVYVAAQAIDSTLLRAQALSLAVPDGVVITDQTAAWLHGVDTQAPGDHLRIPPVSMFVPPGARALRNKLCTSGERALSAEDVMEVHGLLATTQLRTALDQGRLVHRDRAIGCLDALLRTRAFSHEELLGHVERFAKQRGVCQLRELAPLADARSESFGESTLRLRWCDQRSLPRPTPQIPIIDDRGREVYRLDLGVEELRYAMEYDGQAWHSEDDQRAHDKRRRSWIRRERRWKIDPVGHDNVYGALRDVERLLHEGVAEARRRLGCFRPLP